MFRGAVLVRSRFRIMVFFDVSGVVVRKGVFWVAFYGSSRFVRFLGLYFGKLGCSRFGLVLLRYGRRRSGYAGYMRGRWWGVSCFGRSFRSSVL